MRRQLENALGKASKADSDDDQADKITSGLDFTMLNALDGSESMLFDTASDRAQDELLSLGISQESDFFSHANTRAADYAKVRSGELVTQIDESTRDMLRRKIAAGLESGAMREDIIDDIMASDIFSETRATLIADTEVAMANGQGALAGYKEAKAAGVKLKKIWVVADDNACDDCEGNAEEGPIDVDAEFQSGDDAEVCHPGCRCHTESVVEDDEDGNDEE